MVFSGELDMPAMSLACDKDDVVDVAGAMDDTGIAAVADDGHAEAVDDMVVGTEADRDAAVAHERKSEQLNDEERTVLRDVVDVADAMDDTGLAAVVDDGHAEGVDDMIVGTEAERIAAIAHERKRKSEQLNDEERAALRRSEGDMFGKPAASVPPPDDKATAKRVVIPLPGMGRKTRDAARATLTDATGVDTEPLDDGKVDATEHARGDKTTPMSMWTMAADMGDELGEQLREMDERKRQIAQERKQLYREREKAQKKRVRQIEQARHLSDNVLMEIVQMRVAAKAKAKAKAKSKAAAKAAATKTGAAKKKNADVDS